MRINSSTQQEEKFCKKLSGDITPPSSPFIDPKCVPKGLHLEGLNVSNIGVWDFHEFTLEFLESGFFGNVYKAFHSPTKQVFVLKELKDDLEDEESRNMFNEEILLLCKINHPNVIKFKGTTYQEGKLCFLSEYIEGGSLQQLIHKNCNLGLSWVTYLNIALDIARGMAYLHEKDIYHRDLNSKNILVRQVSQIIYQAVIIDLGLSYQRPSVETPDDIIPSGPVGSCYHIAPELFNDSPCSKKADVFSYGIIMCEMISGCPGADPDELPRTIDFGLNVEEFSELASDCPPELLNLAVRCCQLNPTLRPHFVDVVKMVDIILDRVEESETNEMVSKTNYAQSDQDIKQSFTDDYIIESSLLCSCNKKKKKKRRSQTFCEDSSPICLQASYDRFGAVWKTSSRKLLKKNICRCSMCGGRILDFEELRRNSHVGNLDNNRDIIAHDIFSSLPSVVYYNRDNLVNSVDPEGKSFSVDFSVEKKSDRLIKNMEGDMLKNDDQNELLSKTDVEMISSSTKSNIKESYFDNSHFESNAEELSTNSVNKSTLRDNVEMKSEENFSSSDVLVTVTCSSPISIPDASLDGIEDEKFDITEPFDSPKQIVIDSNEPLKSIESYSSLERSVQFPAGAFLKQNHSDLSTKTSQLAQNTPGRLPKFFHHFLRRRKGRVKLSQIDEFNSPKQYEKRRKKLSLHKLFHLSSTSINEDSINQTPPRRTSTNRLLSNEVSDYETRRKSMPVFLRSHHHTKSEPHLRRPFSPGSKSLECREDELSTFGRPSLHKSISGDTATSAPQRVVYGSWKHKRSRSFMDLLLRRKKSDT